MADLQNVLIVEDREENIKPIIEGFDANNIGYTLVKNFDEFEAQLPLLNQ